MTKRNILDKIEQYEQSEKNESQKLNLTIEALIFIQANHTAQIEIQEIVDKVLTVISN